MICRDKTENVPSVLVIYCNPNPNHFIYCKFPFFRRIFINHTDPVHLNDDTRHAAVVAEGWVVKS